MRLWHKDLIEVLPRKQLLGQWRECCLIAKGIAENGTTNHILINKVMDYPMEEFYNYASYVRLEMWHRGYKCDFDRFINYFVKFYKKPSLPEPMPLRNIFKGWHNDRYYNQCFINLQEKFDCGGISKAEWDFIVKDAVERSLNKWAEQEVTENE